MRNSLGQVQQSQKLTKQGQVHRNHSKGGRTVKHSLHTLPRPTTSIQFIKQQLQRKETLVDDETVSYRLQQQYQRTFVRGITH